VARQRKLKKLSHAVLSQAISQILEESLPLHEIDLQVLFRVQDDCDGDREQKLILSMLRDGDICIRIVGPEKTLRFRNGMIGGTASPHTHNALRILMLAMLKDDELDEKRKTARIHP